MLRIKKIILLAILMLVMLIALIGTANASVSTCGGRYSGCYSETPCEVNPNQVFCRSK